LAHRAAALEDRLKHVTRVGNEVFITGANLHLRNGLGQTDCTDNQGNLVPDCPNSLGNLIVGYNDPGFDTNHTGSHNVVVGERHNFSSFGGLVVGQHNTISGDFAVLSGGLSNTASSPYAVVSGGLNRTAEGEVEWFAGDLFADE
jgi:hypothetical protein